MTNQDNSDLERDALERMAQDRVCAFQHYDLADYIEIMTDQELQDIIDGNYPCDCDECITRSVMQS